MEIDIKRTSQKLEKIKENSKMIANMPLTGWMPLIRVRYYPVLVGCLYQVDISIYTGCPRRTYCTFGSIIKLLI